MLAPFLLHVWSQIALGHSSLSKTLIFTKTFLNKWKINMFDPKTPWKSSQTRTKTTLRGDFFALKFAARYWIDFSLFCLPKCLPLGTLLATKTNQKIDRKLDCSKCRPKIAQRSPQDRPRPPQERPKTAQAHPKTTPRPPKSSPRPPKNALNAAQETQKLSHEAVTSL